MPSSPARITMLAFGVIVLAAGTGDARAEAPTYSKDVARILQKNCQDCHRPGQVAPFSLLTYEQARKRADDLAAVTTDRKMPPWPAKTGFGGPFHDERVLTDAEVATIKAWAEAGAPEGDAKDAPPPREFASADWPLGKPDLVLTMPEAYELPADGDDEFRVFVLPTKFAEDRWIRAVDFLPGNRKVVHHVIAAVDPSGAARKKDAEDAKAGYESVGGFGDGVPITAFLPIWTPGSKARFAPKDAGYLLPAGADVLIQMHYHKSGKPETDATAVGLYLSDAPLSRQLRTGFVFPNLTQPQAMAAAAKAGNKRPTLDDLMRDVLVIPAGVADYEVKASTKTSVMGRPIGRDILLTSVMPHMHWLGKDFTFWAVLPDEKNTRVPLIKIEHWNFNWQGTYAFDEPLKLPKGSWFEMEAHFDNTDANPANPSKPPKKVTWGNQTNDEMCIGIFEFFAAEGEETSGARRARATGTP